MDTLDELMAPIEDAADNEEINIEDEDEEEEEPLKVANDPKLPSAEIIECHNCSHIPYRSWCKWCKMGRRRGGSHSTSSTSTTPVFYKGNLTIIKKHCVL